MKHLIPFIIFPLVFANCRIKVPGNLLLNSWVLQSYNGIPGEYELRPGARIEFLSTSNISISCDTTVLRGFYDFSRHKKYIYIPRSGKIDKQYPEFPNAMVNEGQAIGKANDRIIDDLMKTDKQRGYEIAYFASRISGGRIEYALHGDTLSILNSDGVFLFLKKPY